MKRASLLLVALLLLTVLSQVAFTLISLQPGAAAAPVTKYSVTRAQGSPFDFDALKAVLLSALRDFLEEQIAAFEVMFQEAANELFQPSAAALSKFEQAKNKLNNWGAFGETNRLKRAFLNIQNAPQVNPDAGLVWRLNGGIPRAGANSPTTWGGGGFPTGGYDWGDFDSGGGGGNGLGQTYDVNLSALPVSDVYGSHNGSLFTDTTHFPADMNPVWLIARDPNLFFGYKISSVPDGTYRLYGDYWTSALTMRCRLIDSNGVAYGTELNGYTPQAGVQRNISIGNVTISGPTWIYFRALHDGSVPLWAFKNLRFIRVAPGGGGGGGSDSVRPSSPAGPWLASAPVAPPSSFSGSFGPANGQIMMDFREWNASTGEGSMFGTVRAWVRGVMVCMVWISFLFWLFRLVTPKLTV